MDHGKQQPLHSRLQSLKPQVQGSKHPRSGVSPLLPLPRSSRVRGRACGHAQQPVAQQAAELASRLEQLPGGACIKGGASWPVCRVFLLQARR
jgi:hypothetical protein